MYHGVAIEEFAQKHNYISTIYLLLNGKLLSKDEHLELNSSKDYKKWHIE